MREINYNEVAIFLIDKAENEKKRKRKKKPIFQWTIELNYYIEKNINEHIYV